jgi:hypothetical protein
VNNEPIIFPVPGKYKIRFQLPTSEYEIKEVF